ncbi:Arrestin domain-containing protein 5 [Toxocara canis]|uniref:Arrestin domain-containing protein 5 n=1 Tax=Toxocara canis TaxID=6265 RepID=A0A0B2UWT3_TOXCA|nr:Arrestin domain-containing protein 5 [Toxocara canis]
MTRAATTSRAAFDLSSFRFVSCERTCHVNEMSVAKITEETNCLKPHRTMDKPYVVDVLLTKRLYNPGDIIQGEIQFHLRRKLFCDTITVQLCGTAKVFWTTNELHDGSFHALPYGQKQVLIDEKLVVWSAENKKRRPPKPSMEEIIRYSSSTAIRPMKLGKSDDDCGLEPGAHSMFFSFQLPKHGLYTSFEQRECPGCVRYFIVVQCLFNQQVVAKRKLLFPLVCPTDFINNPNATESEDANQKIFFGTKGYLNVQLHLAKKGFVPGERIPVRVFIDNHSGKSIKYAHLSIVQHAFCFVTYPVPCGKDSYMETAGVGLPVSKVVNGNAYKYVPEFNVPALVPGFEIPGCIRVDHTLKFEVGFHRSGKSKYPLCVLKIPIFIGTSPVEDTEASSAMRERQNYRPSEGESTARLYPLNAFSLPPPPSYMESVTGRSDVQESDDECPAYTPLCNAHEALPVSTTEERKKQ